MGWGWRGLWDHTVQPPAQSKAIKQDAQGCVQLGSEKPGFVIFAPSHQVVIFTKEMPLSPLSSHLKFLSDLGKGLSRICL